jgi:hypothetical protein
MTTQTPWYEAILGSHIAAGLLGSIVALRWAPGSSWLERVGNVVAGFGCAIYITPGVVEWFALTTPRTVAATAFATGMFGLSVAAAVVDGIRTAELGAVLRGWLSRKG